MVPQLSIQSQRGLIDIRTTRGHYEIERPKPDVQVESSPTVVTANNRPGQLRIDQSLTENALTGGKPEAFWQRLYSQYKEVAQQNLIQIVEKGNRVGDLRVQGNPQAEMALDEFIEGPPDLQVYGPASPANISFEYTPNDLNMQVEVGKRDVNIQVHRPQITYHRGSVETYMKQYPSVTVTPPVINTIV
ncbi:DUF6470 family protein [Paenibacillus turpanensis]|uniref:DUF6470 family protein n=1 Tax=Paenibacillus turpanensis TaxID=2689078 RepID=UPI00140E1E94